MKKMMRFRLFLLTAVTLLAGLFFLPTTPYFEGFPHWWKRILPDKAITLGLDLQGGIHLVLQVQEEKAVESTVDHIISDLPGLLTEKQLQTTSIQREGVREFVIRFPDDGKHKEIVSEVRKNYPFLETGDEKPGEVRFAVIPDEEKRIRDNAIAQALETIRNRIDQFGVREPLIQRQGVNEILVQLPGVKDPRRAVELIGKTALLEFKMVDDEGDLAAAMTGKVPEGDEIQYERIKDEKTGQVSQNPYLLKSRTLMTGDAISDAMVSIDQQFNEPYVSVNFNSVGAKLFDKITGENVKKRMAIILDGNVYSAPVIQERIGGGRAQITGQFSMEEAQDLAIVLKAGALPAPVEIIQNVTVGPSLGKDSIEKGVRATILAGILVMLFMMVYYRLAGMVANFALMLNLIVLVGGLAALDATLTLPGIAGIILTIGMGVDSNVLIFERIREEIRLGKPIRSAIDAGYDKAFLTIVDSHITTLITALVLFIFGTGPIKGFAVALSLGISINLFTALVGTKVVYDLINSRWKLQRLSI
ncbi:MAG: protein translocase subunit SecD [Nitrospirae bacterium]|nr:protein translocase subunit SecD [Nitrospirota bacterium]